MRNINIKNGSGVAIGQGCFDVVKKLVQCAFSPVYLRLFSPRARLIGMHDPNTCQASAMPNWGPFAGPFALCKPAIVTGTAGDRPGQNVDLLRS